MSPAIGNGKICHVEMPATDIARSAAFYRAVFGWTIRTRGDGAIAFDDGVGEVSGARVTGRPPQGEPGLLVYIMVDSVAATIEAVIANGGELVQGIGADAPEITARFRDRLVESPTSRRRETARRHSSCLWAKRRAVGTAEAPSRSVA